MTIGIYSRHGAHATALAFAAGLAMIGKRSAHRSHSDYTQGQVENFEAVVTIGLRGKGRVMLADYEARGIPVIVIDFGYVARIMGDESLPGGHWQIGVGGLNRLPPFPCPADRWDALGVAFGAPVNEDGPRILCSQTPGDATHPFDTAEKLAEWVATVPHDEHRPHPQVARQEGVDLEPLDAMLGRAGLIVTWNSNVGHDALIAGVPVVALGEAPYSGVTMEARPAYFARVAYAQWTLEEMHAGLPQQFLFMHWLPGIPPALEPATDPFTAEPIEAPAPKRRKRR